MKNIIVSLHFNPAYIGHMKAWYKLCSECGYDTILYFAQEYSEYFEKEDYKFTTNINVVEKFKPDCAVVQNIGIEDISFFRWCRKNKCFLFYILHEPYMGIKEILKERNNAFKQMIASILNLWLCYKSNHVIICSKYALLNCKKYMKFILSKISFMPLLFLDDYLSDETVKREYCSMIGTYTSSHGCDYFIEFIKEAYIRKVPLKFQIATRSDITDKLSDPVFQKMQNTGQLIVQQGRPLTEKEMSEAFRRSFSVWNGYLRSTQSGVLPNSFMQGTPVIATHLPSFDEYVEIGKTGSFIKNMEPNEILNAVNDIQANGKKMCDECRNYFLNHFYYRSQLHRYKSIVSKSLPKKSHDNILKESKF